MTSLTNSARLIIWILTVFCVRHIRSTAVDCTTVTGGSSQNSCLCTVGDNGRRTVDCSRTQLKSPPDFDLLSSYQPISELVLRNNFINILADDAFYGYYAVSVLDLSNNDIKSMADKTFQPLAMSLRELRMENCGQMWVPMALTVLVNLRVLHLANNQIENVDRRALATLTQLTDLDLSGNPLTFSQPYDALADLVNLQHLNLSRCDLTSFPSSLLQHLPRIRRLILNDNLFRSIPTDALIGLNQLEELHLLQNPLKFDRNAAPFSQHPSLRTLTLSQCTLTVLTPNFLAGCEHMETLKIISCDLGEIGPRALARLNRLDELDVSGNGRLSPLINVDLFRDIKSSTTIIGIERMNLTRFPRQALSSFVQLRVVRAGHNLITELTGEDLAVLTAVYGGELYLNDNRISSISPGIMSGTSNIPLTLIDLRNNFMTSLDFIHDDVVRGTCLLGGVTIDVSNNPIGCDCSTVDAVRLKAVSLIGNCRSPIAFSGVSLAPPLGVVPTNAYLEQLALSANHCKLSQSSQLVTRRYECSCQCWTDLRSAADSKGLTHLSSTLSSVTGHCYWLISLIACLFLTA